MAFSDTRSMLICNHEELTVQMMQECYTKLSVSLSECKNIIFIYLLSSLYFIGFMLCFGENITFSSKDIRNNYHYFRLYRSVFINIWNTSFQLYLASKNTLMQIQTNWHRKILWFVCYLFKFNLLTMSLIPLVEWRNTEEKRKSSSDF